MSTQIRVESTPHFLPLHQQPPSSNRTTLRLARVVGLAGSFVLALLLGFAFFPNAVAPYDSTERVALPLQKPDGENILGTNDLGQDLFSELIAGTRASLFTGIIVAVLAKPILPIAMSASRRGTVGVTGYLHGIPHF